MSSDDFIAGTPEKSPKRNSEYEVGYGKPPKHGQFKKGTSGNSKGRPKGAKNKLIGNEYVLNNCILEEAYRKITVMEGGKSTSMPMAQAVAKSLSFKAAKGDIPATKVFLNVVDRVETQNEQKTVKLIENARRYKQHYHAHIKNHKAMHAPYEIPIPHPDHIDINWDTLEVTINGPIDDKSHRRWKALINKIVSLEVELSMPRDWITSLSDMQMEAFEELDDRDQTVGFLNLMYETIPKNDPLYLEYAPNFRKAWIDYYYYYGPSPEIDDEALLSPASMKYWNTYNTKRIESEQHMAARKKFRYCMRSKLAEIMGADWFARHDTIFHTKRDVELDRMRYEYDAGIFNPHNYDLQKGELELFQHEPFLEVFMSWAPPKERKAQLEAYEHSDH